MYTMYFYDSLPPLQFLPSATTQVSLLSLCSLILAYQVQVLLSACSWIQGHHWNIGNLQATPLKKIDSSSSSSHQLEIASQESEGFYDCPLMQNFDWLYT